MALQYILNKNPFARTLGPTLSPLDFSHTIGTMTSRFGIADDEHGESLQRTRRNSISWNA